MLETAGVERLSAGVAHQRRGDLLGLLVACDRHDQRPPVIGGVAAPDVDVHLVQRLDHARSGVGGDLLGQRAARVGDEREVLHLDRVVAVDEHLAAQRAVRGARLP